MIREIFDVLSAAEDSNVGKGIKKNINLNKSRIRSISSYSSNSIFYFPTIVSDQLMPDEAGMVLKMLERSYASFVVACIGLMPFHRVSADDKAAIEDYLQQFHQNIGVKTTNNVNWAVDKLFNENASDDENIKAAQDYLYECWQKCKSSGEDLVKIISEEVSLNDMFNEDAIDPKTKAIQSKFHERMEELNTWGFLGEATEDLWDNDDDDNDEIYEDDELSEDLYLLYGSENDIDLDDEDIEGFDEYMLEAALPAKERNKLPDSAFGLPKERKFPLHDAKHVKLAVKMFGHCPEKDRKALAKKIDSAMTKFKINMKISKNNPIAQYLPKERLNEATLMNKMGKALSKTPLGDKKAQTKAKKAINGPLGKVGTKIGKKYVEKHSDDENSFYKLNNVKIKGVNTENTSDIDELIVYTESADGIINEGNVKEAIDSLKFSLESVSDNKIMSAGNLSKLKTIENKLNKAKTKYVKYLNRYKKKWKENQKSGSKSKLQITFNKMKISNPKAFMKQYGEYIKLINKKLKLVEKRKAQLKKTKGISESVDMFGQIEMDSLDYINKVIDEALTKPDSETFTYFNEATDPNIQRYLDAANAEADRQAKSANQARREADRLRNELERTRNINRANQQKDDDRFAREKKRADAAEKRASDAESKLNDNTPNITNRGDRNLYNHSTFDNKEVFTKMDMEKANDAIPFFAKATVGFIVEGDRSEEVVNRDVLVGIKAFVHRIESRELINNLYNTIINKRKFLKFVKFVSGEEKSLSDLLFGFKELRNDALNTKNNAGRWTSALKQRRRMAKMQVPYLMKEYTPNGTLVMTKNEVDYIKAEYGVDIMDSSHIKMIMDDQFLLGFVVVDQSEELVYVVYDGHSYGFQTYTFQMLERERATSDREIRELYRSLSR